MNDSLRLAAWLSANAKHMRYEQESAQMKLAARQLRVLDAEINSNIKALKEAQKMLAEMRAMLEEVSGVPEQEVARTITRVPVSIVWR
jgi:aspartate-semialdehyde dehydrogenase